jgi:hypothetical protein
MEQAQAREPKLQIYKSVQGEVTYLRFVGTIDENFDGAGCGKGLEGHLVLAMAEIRRITSFGIRQWMEFVTKAGEGCSRIYLVECAPRIVDQLNMVAGFAGKGQVVSFYAPFRCGTCGTESMKLVQVDQSHDAISGFSIVTDPCPNDGSEQYFDDEPHSYLYYLASQPAFEVDPKVATFLAGRTNYTIPDGMRKTRIEKKVHDRFTFISLSGDLGEDLPIRKIAEGLEGDIVFDLAGVGQVSPTGYEQWGQLLGTIAPSTERIIIVGLPAMVLEGMSRDRDLAEKGQVLSLYLPFACKSCMITSQLEIDVAKHYESLRFCTPPEMPCPDCGGPVACVATEVMLSQLSSLPQPAADLKTDAILKWGRMPVVEPEKPTKGTDAASTPRAVAATPSAGWPIVAALAILGVLGAAFAIYLALKPRAPARDPLEKTASLVEASHPQVPEWRDQVFTVHGDQVLVTGSSGFALGKEEGFAIARSTALESLTHHIGTSIHDPLWVEYVGEQFSTFRAKALGDLEKALISGEAEAIQKARARVVEGSEKVARALLDGAGTVIQPDRTAFYWEKLRTRDGLRYRVWALIRLQKDEFKRLVDHYAEREEALSATGVTMFPGMAWRYGFGKGAVVIGLKPDSPLRYIGVLPGDVLISAQDRAILDGRSFHRVLTEEYAELQRAGGVMQMKIQRGDSPVIDHRLPVIKSSKPISTSSPPVKGTKGPTKHVEGGGGKKLPPANIWDDNPFE